MHVEHSRTPLHPPRLPYPLFAQPDENLGLGYLNPPAGSNLSSWAYDMGVVHNATSDVTTTCFSRRLVDARAKNSSNLLAGEGERGWEGHDNSA